jgi:peptidoglycan-N-acetylglucosamine deacetylase
MPGNPSQPAGQSLISAMIYPVRTPWFLKKIYPRCTWDGPGEGGRVYLTFDDGPDPEATGFVLDQLRSYDQRATFFCIGKNVERYPDLYARIVLEGHAVGNHTWHHLNGWNSSLDEYLADVRRTQALIPSRLFRPPYGRASRQQMKSLIQPAFQMKVVMWSLLSGDFDPGISKERCLRNVVRHLKEGDIVVFHDSQKALQKMSYVLPKLLEWMKENGYRSEVLR